ncbi:MULTISPECIES: hypothetical protein [unclassified Paenibacillus]|uniref:hypothetical protein n=1 Tax=unclassified Paenibacillus TaxID=185978 RepID=UPI001AE39EB8|nr:MULTISPECIES: hypothetical protein [unclassified Paenibacillus]MBP1156742.1 hypothetical protein [Paenibacillus sp. PvP091]MBP1172519.1 hypothetical protein [Paenibacillus sp. PvR098]MBP2438900.1 hypothetical protein [Paenibacillus sp. PvP052]
MSSFTNDHIERFMQKLVTESPQSFSIIFGGHNLEFQQSKIYDQHEQLGSSEVHLGHQIDYKFRINGKERTITIEHRYIPNDKYNRLEVHLPDSKRLAVAKDALHLIIKQDHGIR